MALIGAGEKDVAGVAAREFSISRQAVNKHLRQFVADGIVSAKGSTRDRVYELVTVTETRTFALENLDEDRVWREFALQYLEPLPSNVRQICHYGFTEMVNNAIDHSEGTAVTIRLVLNAITVVIAVHDDGIGIFAKIRDAFELEDERHAIFELAKGKLTTDPSRHSGQGVFFTSRVFDRFAILSGKYVFLHSANAQDWLIEENEQSGGTYVEMVINPATDRSLSAVFDQFSSTDEDYRFEVTHVPVRLARLGEDNLVSRSQAKRLLARVEKFSRVFLDFAEVGMIGQAFADEIFRVFRDNHPEITLFAVNANPEVQKMINRAQSAKTDAGSGSEAER